MKKVVALLFVVFGFISVSVAQSKRFSEWTVDEWNYMSFESKYVAVQIFLDGMGMGIYQGYDELLSVSEFSLQGSGMFRKVTFALDYIGDIVRFIDYTFYIKGDIRYSVASLILVYILSQEV